MTDLKKKYKDELESINEQHKMKEVQMYSRFENEKVTWEEKVNKENEENKSEVNILT